MARRLQPALIDHTGCATLSPFHRRPSVTLVPEPESSAVSGAALLTRMGREARPVGVEDTSQHQCAAGERIYAIGDIHGRHDLFEDLIALIDADARQRPPLKTKIVLLGDLIDRGPESASLVQRVMGYRRKSRNFVVLKGNHEQMMLASLEGDYPTLTAWLELGGEATLRSWGVSPDLIAQGATFALVRAARDRITGDVLSWLDRLPLTYRSGRILFVHAGVRPGVPLSRQKPDDLLWIGPDFLQSQERRPFLTIHGHTISEPEPEITSNRIGIDTGAYRTGRLTAIGLERGSRWFLST